jgi:hypothetical protein
MRQKNDRAKEISQRRETRSPGSLSMSLIGHPSGPEPRKAPEVRSLWVTTRQPSGGPNDLGEVAAAYYFVDDGALTMPYDSADRPGVEATRD